MHTCVSVRMYAMKRQKEKNAIKKHRDKGEKCKEETSAGKAKTTNCQRLLSDDALTNQSEPARLPGCCFSPGCQYRPTLWLEMPVLARENHTSNDRDSKAIRGVVGQSSLCFLDCVLKILPRRDSHVHGHFDSLASSQDNAKCKTENSRTSNVAK